MNRSTRAGDGIRTCAPVALVALVSLVVACSGPRAPTLEEQRAATLAALRAGDLTKAIAQADTALAQAPADRA